MKLHVLEITSRSVVVEYDCGEIFQTKKPFEIRIDGSAAVTTDKVITTIHGLKPGTPYELIVNAEGVMSEPVKVRTKREFITLNVREFGALGDGEHDDTIAMQAAIMSCPKDSRIYVPCGTYKITSLFLKSDITLELAKGAVLSAFTDREKFPILPGLIESYDEVSEYNLGSWEGNPLDTFASIITGIYVQNVCICGEGTIDGCADFDNWWKEPKKKLLAYRPRMIFLNHCNNITILGITIKNSPSWNVHPYFSNHLKFYDLKIVGPADSHNTDGINPESCFNVEIAGTYFSVGDDCIAVKSGKLYMGRKFKTPSFHITVRQCLMERGHGAVTIGSEIGAGVKHLEVRDCKFINTDRGLRIKTRRGRGEDSLIDQVKFQNIYMDEVKAPFVINSFYFCDPDGRSEYVASKEPYPVDERTPSIKNLVFEHITCNNCHYCAAYIYGLPEKKIVSIAMRKIKVTFSENAVAGRAAMMDGCEPSRRQGILLKNVEDVILEDIEIDGVEGKKIIS